MVILVAIAVSATIGLQALLTLIKSAPEFNSYALPIFPTVDDSNASESR